MCIRVVTRICRSHLTFLNTLRHACSLYTPVSIYTGNICELRLHKRVISNLQTFRGYNYNEMFEVPFIYPYLMSQMNSVYKCFNKSSYTFSVNM